MNTYSRLILSARWSLVGLFVLNPLFATGPSEGASILSPGNWSVDERARLEKVESQTWSPFEAKVVKGERGMISATVSPLAVYAGLQVLKQGGTAADAAATTAITQITAQVGSVVSYAGIFTMVYYDAKTKTVYSLDAGYNSYLGESDPASIPIGDLGPLNFGRKPTEGGAKGRETLVPGLMAGIEAMHRRFGKLPFHDLFEPAIWYADHGVAISPVLNSYFSLREKFLARTPEGKKFLHQSGRDCPQTGDIFVQKELAATLRAISNQGAVYMYKGEWARAFVEAVQRDGGKATMDDLSRYQPTWTEPQKTSAFGRIVYANGTPQLGAYSLFAGLHLAEARKLQEKQPYWKDSKGFVDLARINLLVTTAPKLDPAVAATLISKAIDVSPAAQLTPEYAASVAPLLDQLAVEPADNGPHHSNSIVVVDTAGNIAAITHTINAVIWGDTGIVVGGIPIPDSAGFQQTVLAAIKPGDRVPNQIIDTISFEGEVPVLATASIGSSLAPESIRVLLGVLGQHLSLEELMAAPPLLATFDASGANKSIAQQHVLVPQGAYSAGYLAELKSKGLLLDETPEMTVSALRGTLAAIKIDPATGLRSAVDQPGVMVFNGAE